MKQACLLAVLAVAIGAVAIACGGGGDDDDATATSGAGTPAAGTTAPATTASGSPAADATSAGTPVPQNTLTPEQATASAGISGGGPGDPTQVIGAVTPLPGTTPIVDPTEIASPEPQFTDVRLIVDMDASTAGIQSSRDVNIGDTFKVAVVLANAPALNNSGGGLSAFQFTLLYDKTKISAPTIIGGLDTDRNPDMNLDALAGGQAWNCLPAPEGDKDDSGGAEGDGNPATGQAYLACFTGGTGTASGDLVLAVVTYQAVASGSSTISLADVLMGDYIGQSFANCNLDPLVEPPGPNVPCDSATARVR